MTDMDDNGPRGHAATLQQMSEEMRKELIELAQEAQQQDGFRTSEEEDYYMQLRRDYTQAATAWALVKIAMNTR